MSKGVKAMVTAELKERYAGKDGVCVVDLTRMNVQQQEELRKALRKKSARLEVVKNSMARRAFQDGPLDPLGRSLDGPCALVTSPEPLTEVAKALVEAAKEFDQLKLKQAIFDGEPDLLTVEELSRMKGRSEMIGELAMLISSPGRAVAGCLRSPQARIAGCLKAMIDKAA
jgi:large subunit ribosomal protein L10